MPTWAVLPLLPNRPPPINIKPPTHKHSKSPPPINISIIGLPPPIPPLLPLAPGKLTPPVPDGGSDPPPPGGYEGGLEGGADAGARGRGGARRGGLRRREAGGEGGGGGGGSTVTTKTAKLLAFTIARLWDERERERRLLTLEMYENLGGVHGATDHAWSYTWDVAPSSISSG